MSESEYENPTATRLDFNAGVLMMPVDTYTHEQYIALSSGAKAVYQAMLTEFRRDSKKKNGFKNPNNEVTISEKYIENLTKLSHTTVVKAIFELRGYRQSEELVVTVKRGKESRNRKWEFEKYISDSRCFVFVVNPGGLERNTTKYSLNGYYLNTKT